ncbi:hypothetical protein [Caballeronia sp. J97]|uniref:hypothetical protein n=1 Tax=Caballeronia sp. J97 TaxID=2805429 RepID=UPI002AB03916|nr:hypothetical protein [Caballeronia sp. J97]
MRSQTTSLKFFVNDWFGKDETFRVTRPVRSRERPWRAVRVEVMRSSATFALFFFQHGDGSWCVYPPAAVQPSMKWP